MRLAAALTVMLIVLLVAYAMLPRWQRESSDAALARAVSAYNLRPLATKPLMETPKFVLGRALFFDPILSGARNISCATCHMLTAGSSDDLPRSIGAGGEGSGAERTARPDGSTMRRNALDLWNRDNNEASAFFWDGRVDGVGSEGAAFRTPMGDALPSGIENTMAAQALFPLVAADEMLGRSGDVSPSDLPSPHALQLNDLAQAKAERAANDGLAMAAVHGAILNRLLGNAGADSARWQETYRQLFKAAYPDVSPETFSIVHVANAIAHYEELAFATRATPWDRYLGGELTALSDQQKRGALIFLGKGRCAACHSGQLLSDFGYHSIGVPTDPAAEPDLGRFEVTGRPEDRFKFRTPPLRNVALSGPYLHDGSATSLVDVVRQHLDPHRFAYGYNETGDHRMSSEEIMAISPLLTSSPSVDGDDLRALVSFLDALTGDPSPKEDRILIPATVPSGIPLN
ncbi:MAG TPA: cytochrome c peroxidase [Devosia sp.]|jgi:cytochrome c peroxidase|uniref:cytochrome-c peroxidase n=1 Tax=Devosia sp. TaxID=1871048 RepID=UPI002DDD0107|nr:cytochrome c peroxidase [Devosia sp.]HEV2515161.1 cytochrome c peroxidase [Devosia sp.]